MVNTALSFVLIRRGRLTEIEKAPRAQYLYITVQERQPESESRNGLWAKRAGIIAFLFFLAKGLAWLGLAAGAYFSFN